MNKKTILVFLVFSLFLIPAALLHARTAYVTDSFEITLRSGPSEQNKIITMLPTATRLRTLEESEGWLRVRTPEGKEGWVLKRFTTDALPKELVIKKLQQENERLAQNSTSATDRMSTLASENKELKSSLSSTREELAQLKENYDTTVEKLTVENMELRSSSRMRWFLTGAGVVVGAWLVGLLMGRISQKKRSRSSLSLG